MAKDRDSGIIVMATVSPASISFLRLILRNDSRFKRLFIKRLYKALAIEVLSQKHICSTNLMHYKIPVAKVHKTLNAIKQRQEISFQFLSPQNP